MLIPPARAAIIEFIQIGIVRIFPRPTEPPVDAIRTATPDKIEAIDMGRRGIHDEGSRTLMERLHGKVRVDFDAPFFCSSHRAGRT